MRIAMVAPLIEAIPPRLYGGTERVVSLLTEELVRRGHEMTLFASGDSQTSAELVACSPGGCDSPPKFATTSPTRWSNSIGSIGTPTNLTSSIITLTITPSHSRA